MDFGKTGEPGYILGHSDGELARLEQQAEIFRQETDDILRRGGIGEGMRVLDIGCGVGDVAMAAARMVGPEGEVVGIDNAGSALFLARARAAGAGSDWVSFEEADVHSYEPQGAFDALVGRFILMHLSDPAASLQRLTGFLKPGGVVAFIEMDISEAGAHPDLPLLNKVIDWIVKTYDKVGVEPNMGSKLYATFRAAGLEPRLHGSCKIESGPNSITYDFAAQTLRTLVPAMEEFGIASAEEIGVDILADRLRRQAVSGDHCIFFPRIVGAWASKDVAAT